MKKRFVVRKYIMATSAREALKLERNAAADDVWIDEDWKKDQQLGQVFECLIASTTTAKGLKVACRLDRRRYPVGRRVSAKEVATTVNLTPDRFHGEWNYTIRPANS